MSRLVWLAVACMWIAGCTSGSAGGQDSDTGANRFTGERLPDAATIVGLVVDDAQAPVVGADIGLVELNLLATSDDAGAFRFDNIPPGTYVLQAGRIGYEAASSRITLEANAEESVRFTLVPLAVVEPYYNSFGPFSGYFECQLGTPIAVTPCTGDTIHDQDLSSTVFPQDKRQLKYDLTSDDWSTMVGEARWQKASAGTGQGLAIYPSFEKRPTSHWWCEADGQSPIQFRYESESENSVCTSSSQNSNPKPSREINPLVLVADPGFAGTDASNPPLRALVQQRFELTMTVFYYEPAPEGFSALTDG